MTIRLFRYIFLAVSSALLALTVGCNSKSDSTASSYTQEVSETSTAVKSFALSANKKVLANLDSVFFSIDLHTAEVYNADSLPVGTDVSRLVVKIGLPTVSEATLYEPGEPGEDYRAIDYLTESGDSINFSRGPVRLHVVSNDGESQRDYLLRVNVHLTEPDSMSWSREALATLPGGVSDPMAQKAVKLGQQALCMVQRADGSAVVSTSADPGSAPWTTKAATLPANARIATLTAVGSTLYMLDDSGTLHTSADGAAWSSTGQTLYWLYGDYDGSLLGARQSADGWEAVLYPSMATFAIPDEMPVDATSSLVTLTTKWASRPTVVMMGGVTAGGALTSDVWGFDGSVWAKINTDELSEPMRDITLVAYYSYVKATSSWETAEYPTLLAIGGRDITGTAQRSVYVSVDNGVRWRKATDLLTLPDYLPAEYGADALIFSQTLTTARSGASGAWQEMPSRKLSPWLMVKPMSGATGSRAVTAITEWECPYIYLFGGYASSGELHDTVWRGVINRLQFKPLQ